MSVFDFLVIGPKSTSSTPTYLRLRCPHCNTQGSFPPVHDFLWAPMNGGGAVFAGPRFCPNPNCQKLVFFISRSAQVIASFPPEVLDFDASGVPAAVSEALVEAIKCHGAECYRASALMVRRTLEEICLDKGIKGRDLKVRIEGLGATITLPKELLDALDQLRILGNDAAHIEARTYDQIGRDEVEVAILLAKEILKATYQYTELLGKLKALAKPSGPALASTSTAP